MFDYHCYLSASVNISYQKPIANLARIIYIVEKCCYYWRFQIFMKSHWYRKESCCNTSFHFSSPLCLKLPGKGCSKWTNFVFNSLPVLFQKTVLSMDLLCNKKWVKRSLKQLICSGCECKHVWISQLDYILQCYKSYTRLGIVVGMDRMDRVEVERRDPEENEKCQGQSKKTSQLKCIQKLPCEIQWRTRKISLLELE